ncbi:MAG: DUF397 domain-containing protein [Actinomycetota bacterium]
MTHQHLPRTPDGGLLQPGWRTSSYSGNNGGQCVEVAFQPHDTTPAWLVRDSKNPHGPVLTFSPARWESFTARIKAIPLDLG